VTAILPDKLLYKTTNPNSEQEQKHRGQRKAKKSALVCQERSTPRGSSRLPPPATSLCITHATSQTITDGKDDGITLMCAFPSV
jgi:hypothetical protein